MTRSTPYGLPSMWSSIHFSSISSSSGVNASAPSTPNPPARLTAATTSRQCEKAKIGNSIPNLSQTGVRNSLSSDIKSDAASGFVQSKSTVLRVTSQRSSEFTTPTRDEIVRISAQHVAMMETSDADDVWVWVNMHHVLIHTIGR